MAKALDFPRAQNKCRASLAQRNVPALAAVNLRVNDIALAPKGQKPFSFLANVAAMDLRIGRLNSAEVAEVRRAFPHFLLKNSA